MLFQISTIFPELHLAFAGSSCAVSKSFIPHIIYFSLCIDLRSWTPLNICATVTSRPSRCSRSSPWWWIHACASTSISATRSLSRLPIEEWNSIYWEQQLCALSVWTVISPGWRTQRTCFRILLFLFCLKIQKFWNKWTR